MNNDDENKPHNKRQLEALARYAETTAAVFTPAQNTNVCRLIDKDTNICCVAVTTVDPLFFAMVYQAILFCAAIKQTPVIMHMQQRAEVQDNEHRS